MWYDKAPVADERHARHLLSSMSKEADAFVKIYEMAKERKDAGFCKQANDAHASHSLRSKLKI